MVSPKLAYVTRFVGEHAIAGDQEPYEWLGNSVVYVIDRTFHSTGEKKWRITFLPRAFDNESQTVFFGKDVNSDGKVYSSSGDLILSDVGPFHEGALGAKRITAMSIWQEILSFSLSRASSDDILKLTDMVWRMIKSDGDSPERMEIL